MPGTKVDSKQRITVRNLRIREDTAKYLRNLDPESAYYDPKTRSMRENPYKTTGKKPDELQYAGDNFVRYSGQTSKVAEAQLFAWQAHEKGVDVHFQAEPTKAEVLHKKFDVKKDEYKESEWDKILKKYGGEENVEHLPKELIFAQSENYVEYSRRGQVIKGAEKGQVKSVYEEDVYINNHTAVWGSFWKNGKWGYKCCHSMIKNSYCTGVKGREGIDSGIILPYDEEDAPEEVNQNEPKQEEQTNNTATFEQQTSNVEKMPSFEERSIKLEESDSKSRKRKRSRSSSSSSSSSSTSSSGSSSSASGSSSSGTSSEESSSDDEDSINKEKLKKALKAEDEKRREAEKLLELDERKRPYNSMYEAKAPTTEELEAYQMRRQRDEDPMAAFFSKK